jgi:hypothetical protein
LKKWDVPKLSPKLPCGLNRRAGTHGCGTSNIYLFDTNSTGS